METCPNNYKFKRLKVFYFMVFEENEKELEIERNEPEKSNGTNWLERPSFRIALLSTFSALSVVIGFMLVFLPNIELFTLMIFPLGV